MLHEFLSTIKSPQTKKAYRIALTQWQQFEPGEHPTFRSFSAYKTLLVEKGLAATSVNLKLAAVRAYVSWLVKAELRPEPCRTAVQLVDGLEVPQLLPKCLSREDVATLIDNAPSLREKSLWAFLFSSGARISEALALTTELIDLDNRIAVILNGKGNKQRKVYFSREAAAYLREYLSDATGRPLWVNKRNEGLSTRFVEETLRNVSRAVLGYSVTPHQFRHTFITEVLDATGDIAYATQAAGHSSPALVIGRYGNGAIKRFASVHDKVFGGE